MYSNVPLGKVFTRPENFPFKQEIIYNQGEVDYKEQIHYICINSSDRDITKDLFVNKYRIDLQDNFKNVTSLEIVSGSVANKNSVQNNPYLVLRIEGLNHLTFSNNNINNGFALLYLKPTSGLHVQPELGCLQRNIRVFDTPLANLNSIALEFRKPDGTLFSFGDTSGETANDYQNSLVFKIVTRDRKRLVNSNV